MKKQPAPSNNPILLIDPFCSFGKEFLAFFLNTPCVLVCKKGTSVTDSLNRKVFFYKRRIRLLPSYSYKQIIVVYQGEEEIKKIAFDLLEKAKKDNATLLFFAPRYLASDVFLKKLTNTSSCCFVAFFDDLFSKDLLLPSFTQALLEQAKQGRMSVFGNGLLSVSPVSLFDLITKTQEYLTNKQKDQRFFAFPKTRHTLFSIARMMQKIDPSVMIDFSKKNEKEEALIALFHIIPSSYPLEEKLRTVYHELLPSKGIRNKGRGERTDKQKKKQWFIRATAFVVALAFLPFVTSIIFGLLGFLLLLFSGKQLDGNIKGALAAVSLASKSFFVAKQASSIVLLQAKVIGSPESVQQADTLLRSADTLSLQATALLSSALSIMQMEKGERPLSKDAFTQTIGNIQQSLQTLNRLAVESPKFFSRAPLLLSMQTYQSFDPLFSVLPTVVGYNGKQTYLVLFQNNMELRPGGGFIGSYGLLSFEEGRVVDFTIHDVYTADGKLKGHIEPQYPIRRYIPSVHLFLRDSNFYADFSKNSQIVASLLFQETGEHVDGVIALDVTTLKDFLSVIGPVEVSDYQETVTAENMYLLTQKHAEKRFFPGSTQKKDFLQALFAGILQKTKTKEISFKKLLAFFKDQTTQKHMLFGFSDKTTQDAFSLAHLTGSLQDRRETKGSVNDFLLLSEANLGVNKANYFVTRTMQHAVTISEQGSVKATTTVVYQNQSQKDTWPGGVYKNYLRFFVPLGSTLSSVSIDGGEQQIIPAITDFYTYEAKGFIPPAGLEVEQGQESGKSYFGFLVSVPEGSEKTIAVTYTLPVVAPVNDPTFTYSLLFFKQPGTDKDPFTFTISYPDSFSPISKDPPFVNNTYQGVLDTDKTISLKFAKR